MQSRLVGLLFPKGSPMATLLVRRGDGQFALAAIDARVACASILASGIDSRVGARGISAPDAADSAAEVEAA